jgi:hypothetical protein
MNIFYTSVPARSRMERIPPSAGSRLPDGSRPYLVQPRPQTQRSDLPAPKTVQLFPHEPEDARLTGATRSLFRRLLALNLPAGVRTTAQVSETVVTRSPAVPVPSPLRAKPRAPRATRNLSA